MVYAKTKEADKSRETLCRLSSEKSAGKETKTAKKAVATANASLMNGL